MNLHKNYLDLTSDTAATRLAPSHHMMVPRTEWPVASSAKTMLKDFEDGDIDPNELIRPIRGKRPGKKKSSDLNDDKADLDDDQKALMRHAMKMIETVGQLLMLITGPPGTGKTKTARAIIQKLKELGIPTQFTATTGCAAGMLDLCFRK